MRDGKKYRIVNLILDTDDNPTTWTEEEYNIITNNEVVIGYFMKLDGTEMKMNIYLIPEKYCRGNIVTKNDLKLAYIQWLVNIKHNQNKTLVQFHNPPIENWLDTKEQWIKKTANKLSKTFDKP